MTSVAAAEPAAGGGNRLAAMLKDAALTAGVALVLAVPLIGFRLTDSSSGAGVAPRLSWLAIGVPAVFVGRLALSGLLALRPPRRGLPEGGKAGLGQFMHRQLPWLGPLLVALAVALPFMPFASGYIVDLGITLLIYIMLGWGLNVVVGLAGLLDLGYVAFYAVGAYTFALLSGHFGLGFWECLPIAGLFAAGFGVLLGFPVLRLRGDYLAIVTLGFGEMVRIVLLNWRDFTGGPDGISGIPRPTLFGLVFARRAPAGHATFHEMFGLAYDPLQRQIFLYLLVLGLVLLTNFLTTRLRRLPIGRAWEALREDEIACRALGINPTMAKLSAFGIGASLAGVAGAFFATRQGFVSPESFSFIESAIILAIVVLGGMGSQIGVVCAAAVLVLLPELGREFAQFRMLLFGAAMVLIMGWRPQGLLAHREPSLRLHGRTGR